MRNRPGTDVFLQDSASRVCQSASRAKIRPTACPDSSSPHPIPQAAAGTHGCRRLPCAPAAERERRTGWSAALGLQGGLVGALWSTFGALLEHFRSTSGTLLVVLEHLWSTLGGPLEHFGALWSTFGAPSERFWSTFGALLEHFWRESHQRAHT